ncbi:MAG: AbrB/MazE/SpoVT family DNA-binding domain-containing protein [Dermatophilaceae bacterium]
MSGTYAVTMGDRGRLVIPAELRERRGLATNTPLILLETSDGLVLLTRTQVRDRVQRDLADTNLVADLLAERRRAAAEEDATT